MVKPEQITLPPPVTPDKEEERDCDITLDKTDTKILDFLSQEYPTKQGHVDIMAYVERSRGTVSKRLKHLRELGLVEADHNVITQKGKKYIDKHF